MSGYGRLISLRLLRCGQVDLSVAAKLPLERLEVEAHTADLSVLAGHPTLRHLIVKGPNTPIDLRWFATIPNLEILVLSGSTLEDAVHWANRLAPDDNAVRRFSGELMANETLK